MDLIAALTALAGSAVGTLFISLAIWEYEWRRDLPTIRENVRRDIRRLRWKNGLPPDPPEDEE